MVDVGLTHIALTMTNPEATLAFYRKYAAMEVVHQRTDSDTGQSIYWLSDRTRPFVIVFIEANEVNVKLEPIAHLGVGCASREEVDELCEQANEEGVLIYGPIDSGPPVGYWALLKDPDGHTLELAYGQEVGLTVEEGDVGPKQ